MARHDSDAEAPRSHSRRQLRRSGRRLLVSATALATSVASIAVFGVGAAVVGGGAAAAAPLGTSTPDLGPNVLVFDPSMSQADIQAKVNAISTLQVHNEMGEARFSLLFKPGVYGSEANPLIFQVGFYTEVAGLGQNPGDVTIHGSVNVYNQCDANGCIALDNFWRSLSNLTVDIAGGSGCQSDSEFWAVSQAAPLRRVNIINGQTSLMDYCTAGPQYASGGFMADSSVPGVLVSGSQQQWITETSNTPTWTNGVWNQVFAGTTGAPATDFAATPEGFKAPGINNYTTLANDPLSRDKPYFYLDATGGENIFVPSASANASGTTWGSGSTPGTSLSINKFFVAQPGDTIETINRALACGLNLMLTPGIYRFNQPIKVTRRDTVVLGLGFATLIPTTGNAAIKVADVPGVKLAGLLIDAGTVKSQNLVEVGTSYTEHASAKQRAKLSDASDPTTLSDVFLRIGGDIAGQTETALTVNSDNVLLDDIWAWRADHGNAGTVGWTINRANQGLIVNGDNLTATGLFVEHFQKYDVTWNGNGGQVVFFQNEMPYDAPDQASWSHNGVNGYAAIHVDKHVKSFQGWGLGSYIYTNVVPTLHSESGFEVPVTPGVQLHDVLTISLNAAGTIDHVVNEEGPAVTPTVQGPAQLVLAP